jgi:dTDP-4-dehydrorhamnose reductase
LRVLITGAGGMVGSAVRELCETSGDTVFAYDHRALDITSAEDVRRTVSTTRPDALINCAAWTDVDGCESDYERAFAANATGPENLANASREANAVLLTISTDYVFDGSKEGFYTQEDRPNPQSVYARSKLAGELRSQAANPRTIVVRSGFIFGPGGKNFLSTVVERARRGEKIAAIIDAYGTPTYATDLAIRLRELVRLSSSGVFHVANAGDGASYEEFARQALLYAGLEQVKVDAILTQSLERPAPRPRNSRLRCVHSQRLGLGPLPHWHDALGRFVAGS